MNRKKGLILMVPFHLDQFGISSVTAPLVQLVSAFIQ